MSRPRLLHRCLAAVLLAAALTGGSLVSSAFGGPGPGSLRTMVARALKLSKGADVRSRRALATARSVRPGPPGAPGPAGPAGPAGGSGAGAGPGPVAVIDFRAAPGITRQVYNRGGLVLSAACAGTASVPTISVRASTTVDRSLLHASWVEGPGTPGAVPVTRYLQKNDFRSGGLAQELVSTGHIQGTATYSTPTGTVTTLTYGSEQGAFADGSTGCWFGGTAETNG